MLYIGTVLAAVYALCTLGLLIGKCQKANNCVTWAQFSFPFAGTLKRRSELIVPWMVFHTFICIGTGIVLLVGYLHTDEYFGDGYSVCEYTCRITDYAQESDLRLVRQFFRAARNHCFHIEHYHVAGGAGLLQKPPDDEAHNRRGRCTDSMSSGNWKWCSFTFIYIVLTFVYDCSPIVQIPFHFRKENMYIGDGGYKHLLADTSQCYVV